MPFEDLREYLGKVRELDEIRQIDNADWNLEIGALTEIMETSFVDKHPLLLFDNIRGYSSGWRVITNIMNTSRRTAIALDMPPNLSQVEILKHWKERLKTVTPIPPRIVSSGPVEENIDASDKVDVLKFPVPKWHEKDGGRYIGTACMVITKDPETGWNNLGVYRVQVHNKNTLGLYISPGKHGDIMERKYWSRGESCPVVVTFGQEPAIWMAATDAPKYGDSEYDWAGWLRGKPVDVIMGQTGIMIPATAEIAIEGYIPDPAKEGEIEGPFGEWPGYYASGALHEPAIKVDRVLYRNNPILAGAPPVKPTVPYSHGIPFGAAVLWNTLEQAGIQDVQGVWAYFCSTSGGGGLPFIVISLKQRYPGHAKQALLVAAGARSGGYLGRYVIVVDEDVNPADLREVMWAVASRSDPASSVDIIRDTWSSYLDARIPPERKAAGDITNSRALINACRPWHWKDKFPPVNAISSDLKEATIKKWGEIIRPSDKS